MNTTHDLSITEPKTLIPMTPAEGERREPSLYTLPQLEQRYGPASLADVNLYVGESSQAELVAVGKTISTDRVTTDSARLLGQAADFVDDASEEELDALPGVSRRFLRTAIWAAAEDARRAEAFEHGRSASTSQRSQHEQSYAVVRDQALARREQMRELLVSLSGNDAKQRAAIDVAYGVAKEPRDLASSLRALVQIGQQYLADTSPEMVKRREDTRLRPALLERTEALAEVVLSAGAAAQAALALPAVTQGEVDWWDGVALWFLKRIIDMFDAGRESQPSIPRLVPQATRSALKLRNRAPAATPASEAAG